MAILIGALVAPAVIGAMTLTLSPVASRRGIPAAIARGYPLTVVQAVLLVFLALLAIWRKGHSLVRRWTDAHVPFIVKPGAYDQVAEDLRRAVEQAGIAVTPREASAAMSKPARWLAAVAGRGAGALVPDRMIELHGAGIEILIYPMDLLISGKPDLVMRARAATASRLTTAAAHLTVSAEAQAIEDRLTEMAHHPDGVLADTGAAFAPIDEQLATLRIPYEKWEVLYRPRLQVERDIRARAMAEGATSKMAGAIGLDSPVGDLGRLLVGGAAAAVNAAADERTLTAVGTIPAPWPWRALVITGVTVVPIVAGAARRLIRRSRMEAAGAERQQAS
ncbi:MAG: hypothetical protein ABI628_08745 [Chloroflexota bacterium]